MPPRQGQQPLGHERDRAPCLPPALLSCFAALPIEHAGHGHPGILYAGRDRPDEPAETFVEGYRLCYSFSAKATLFNLIADALQRDSDQQLAGWFFVGEGAGQPRADAVAQCMWDQFRLALCKAIAGNESAVDDATFQRTFKKCSQMMGVVILRSVQPVEVDEDRKEPGLRYAVHEFAFPFPKQKIRQDIRSKIKVDSEAVDLQDLSVPVSTVPTTSEVVDLVSDDDDPDDDKAIIHLPAVKTASAPPPSTMDDDDAPLLAEGRVSLPIEGSVCGQADAQPPSANCPQAHSSDAEDGAKAGPVQRPAQNQEESGQKENSDSTRSADTLMVDATGITTAANLIESARGAHDNDVLSATLAKHSGPSIVSASVSCSGATTSAPLSSTASADVAAPQQSSTAAPEKRPVNVCQNGLVASYAKLRVGKRSPASSLSASGTVSDHPHASHAGSCGASGALQRDAANVRGAALAADDTNHLVHRLQEYDKACDAHRSLHHKAHLKAKAARQSRQDAQDDCKLFVQNSVLVTVMNLAMGREGSKGLHGVLAGVTRGDKISILQALAADGDPPSFNGGSMEQDATWLRKQAQSLFPEACLLPERKLPKCDDAPAQKDETAGEGAMVDMKGQVHVQQVAGDSEDLKGAGEKSEDSLKSSAKEPIANTEGTAALRVEAHKKVRPRDGDEVKAEHGGLVSDQIEGSEKALGEDASPAHKRARVSGGGCSGGSGSSVSDPGGSASSLSLPKPTAEEIKSEPAIIEGRAANAAGEGDDADAVVVSKVSRVDNPVASLDLTEGADEGDAGSRAKVNANEISGKDENDPAHVNITTVPPDSARSMSKDTSEGLVVLGYFRVTARGAGLRTGDSDKSMLCALNAQGLGLLCSVQDGTEVVSVPEFVQIVGFSEDAQRDLPLKWEVVQEPFLPRRVLQECAASAQEADGGRDEAAAALVNVCTVNLRVQEAYVKRHLCMSTVAGTTQKACRPVFFVGGPEIRPEEADDEVMYQGTSSRQESATIYTNPYKTSPGAPGWREYILDGRPYYYHPKHGNVTQWDPPAGWHVPQTQGSAVTSSRAHTSPASPYLPAQQSMSSAGHVPEGPSVGSVGSVGSVPMGSVGAANPAKPVKTRRPPTCLKCGQPKKGHTCTNPYGDQPVALPPHVQFPYQQGLANVPYPAPQAGMQGFTQDKRQCSELQWPPGADAAVAPSHLAVYGMGYQGYSPVYGMGYQGYPSGHGSGQAPARK